MSHHPVAPGERVGCLTIVAPTPKIKDAMLSQLRVVVRSIWSNPPSQGARIVATVLGTKDLYAEWFE